MQGSSNWHEHVFFSIPIARTPTVRHTPVREYQLVALSCYSMTPYMKRTNGPGAYLFDAWTNRGHFTANLFAKFRRIREPLQSKG